MTERETDRETGGKGQRERDRETETKKNTDKERYFTFAHTFLSPDHLCRL